MCVCVYEFQQTLDKMATSVANVAVKMGEPLRIEDSGFAQVMSGFSALMMQGQGGAGAASAGAASNPSRPCTCTPANHLDLGWG
jgi:hypothetical protein